MPLTELVLPQTASEKNNYAAEYSIVAIETLDLLATLGIGRKNAKPIALLARQMDTTKKNVQKMITKARAELEDTDQLIMNTGHGSYYLEEVQHGDSEDSHFQSLLQLFG